MSVKKLYTYKSLVFDCDGVVLNSNPLKIEAYRETAKAFGANEAQITALVECHVSKGGISRYPKFEHFLTEIMHQPITKIAMDNLLTLFSETVIRMLMGCEIAPNLGQLRQQLPHTKWIVVSGADQRELRHIFKERDIDGLFDGGIFGSPDDKDTILKRLISQNELPFPALFIGDSKYDCEASRRAGLDNVFLSEWTDFSQWENYCNKEKIPVFRNLDQLMQEMS